MLMLPILKWFMMVLIISQDDDYSTLEIIKWLIYYNVSYIRVNSQDKVQLEELDIQSKTFIFKIDGKIVNLADISYIWYRRGKFNFFGKSLIDEVYKFQNRETFTFNEYIFSSKLLKGKDVIGNWLQSEPNKLLVLEYANKLGLKTPYTYVTGSKHKALTYLKEEKKFISKGIGNNLMYKDEVSLNAMYTETFIAKDLSEYDNSFFPSLIQDKVAKKFEIRTFVLYEDIYSMAIFSQNNEQTSVDFRKYDQVVPNRTVPFNLPTRIENKLKLLLKKLGLNSASIDLILNEDDEYIFLEVNPVGQFGMVSIPCNFYLEKLIARKLATHEQQN
jgi:ATP-GRASP peptide maturase of grasp-with-spasm system